MMFASPTPVPTATSSTNQRLGRIEEGIEEIRSTLATKHEKSPDDRESNLNKSNEEILSMLAALQDSISGESNRNESNNRKFFRYVLFLLPLGWMTVKLFVMVWHKIMSYLKHFTAKESTAHGHGCNVSVNLVQIQAPSRVCNPVEYMMPKVFKKCKGRSCSCPRSRGPQAMMPPILKVKKL
eukprot:scaffold6834_cov44-Cyclotella_meneghiniana.AAC.7